MFRYNPVRYLIIGLLMMVSLSDCSCGKSIKNSAVDNAGTPSTSLPADKAVQSTPPDGEMVPSNVPLQNGEIVPAIVSFVGEPELRAVAVDTQAIAFGQKIQLYSATLNGGDKARFQVNSQTGEVVGFYLFGKYSQEVTIDLAAAQQTATDFAKAHYSKLGLIGTEPYQAELIDHGSYKTYEFVWVRTDASSGAFLPQEVIVWINPVTGQVVNYMSKDVEVTVSTQPAIQKEQAIEIAKSQAQDVKDTDHVYATLFVSTIPIYEPNGVQALLWVVSIQGEADAAGLIRGESIYIDAQTGSVVYSESVE